MGREIKRVPMDFNFPLGASYADAMYTAHRESCDLDDHDECETRREPPVGDGWQLWQTVSDGPISPVFKTPDELIAWMSEPVPVSERTAWRPEAYPPNPWARGWRRETAEWFVKSAGWMPSMVVVGGKVLTTDEIVEVAQGRVATTDAA